MVPGAEVVGKVGLNPRPEDAPSYVCGWEKRSGDWRRGEGEPTPMNKRRPLFGEFEFGFSLGFGRFGRRGDSGGLFLWLAVEEVG